MTAYFLSFKNFLKKLLLLYYTKTQSNELPRPPGTPPALNVTRGILTSAGAGKRPGKTWGSLRRSVSKIAEAGSTSVFSGIFPARGTYGYLGVKFSPGTTGQPRYKID
jgi:hypothetical protein